MELDRLGVELRQRNGFESLDLGLAMLQAWRKPVLAAWCATFWPFALVVSVLLWRHPAIAHLVVWWSKPFFDRVLLHVYGAAMFGAPPDLRDTLRALPRLATRTALLPALTVMRLSMARSLFLPVVQLEGQRGAPARARRRVLGARAYGHAAWLTFFCSNLVGIWAFGAMLLLLQLLPIESVQGLGWQSLLDDPDSIGLRHAMNALFFLADTIVEPYFVAAGFSLYLNRRSELEGWDLEVAFRRMAHGRAAARGAATAAMLALVVAAGVLMAPAPVLAAYATPPSTARSPDSAAPRAGDPLPFPRGAIKRELAQVLADPVFGHKETRTRWVPRARDDKATGPDRLSAWLERIARIMDALARPARIAVWVVIAVAIGALVYVLVRYRERWLPARIRRAVPATVFGLDVRAQSLPADVAAAARAALAQGDVAGALGLLYRGALFALIHFAAVDFHAGDTERDCWRRAAPALAGDAGRYFRSLLDAWLRTAYAHRAPPHDELARLCDEWPRHFEREAFVKATP